MACRTPVLTSDVGALPEVAGDAALLIPPTDVEAITAGMDRLLRDAALRDRLAPGATVVLDDIDRAGEQEVLRRWEAELGLRFQRLTEARVAVATS